MVHDTATKSNWRLEFGSESVLDDSNLLDYQGNLVHVWGVKDTQKTGSTPVLNVARMNYEGPRALSVGGEGLTGPQTVETVLLKFTDSGTDPWDGNGANLNTNPWYTSEVYGTSFPQIGDFWQKQSYGAISITGAVFGPFTLPHTRAYYCDGTTGCLGTSSSPPNVCGGFDLNAAASDGAAAADSVIDFTTIAGVNFFFNGWLDGCSWGGSHFYTQDSAGIKPTTWMADWGWQNIAVIGHEMGHMFGLPHGGSGVSGPYNDGTDVMSGLWDDCPGTNNPDATYGCLPPGLNMGYRNVLGWIPSNRILTTSSAYSIELFPRDVQSPASGNYMMVKIPIPGTGGLQYYTVEAARKSGGSTSYDQYLIATPGGGGAVGVIIREFNPARGDGRAAIVDLDGPDNCPSSFCDGAPDGNGDPDDAYGRRISGNTYYNLPHGVKITVLGSASSGGSTSRLRLVQSFTTLG